MAGDLTPATFTASTTYDGDDVMTEGESESITFTIVATAAALVATTIVEISGDSQTATVSTELPDPFIIEVRDQDGDALSGITVAFAVTAGGGSLSASCYNECEWTCILHTDPRLYGWDEYCDCGCVRHLHDASGIEVYTLEGVEQVSERISLHSDNASGRGLDVYNGFAYVVDITDRQIYVYNISTLARDTTKEFTFATFAGSASNTLLTIE